MQFGVSMFPTDDALSVVDLGRMVEEMGFESLFFPEHTHIPVSRRSPYPAGGELPPRYYHALDPFVALGAVAAVTTRLRIGTGICLVIERDPITLAKEVASLDHLSGGRVLFGIGGGWNYEEMEDHGTRPARRWRILRERILAMQQIWTQDEAEYHGRFVDFDPLWSWPKPVQKPHPPILIGGNGPRTLERVVEYCDGWFPFGGARSPRLVEQIGELQQMAKAAGRGPLSVTVYGVPPDPELIARYAEAGAERCIFVSLPPAGADEVRPILKQYQAVMRDFA
jgi:probable F420-dependent oxidoreductase